jgi:hypothetical protein
LTPGVIPTRIVDGARCVSYVYDMNAVLTTRVSETTMRRLRSRAREVGKTPSALVRDLLDRELGRTDDDPPALDRTRRWVGSVADPGVPAGRSARTALATWDPDRRG